MVGASAVAIATAGWLTFGAAANAATADTAASDDSSTEVSGLVVTATKRETLVQDTPQSIQVLTAETIVEQDLRYFDDYISKLPGIQYTTPGGIPIFGSNTYFMRGLTSASGGGNTTGIYLDELPINNISPPRLVDVARIEALKGPQGTLFGEGAMGGILRIITNQPKLSVFEFNVRGTAATIAHGSQNYSAEGTVNVPLGDKIAYRASAYYDRNGGWIDSLPYLRETFAAPDPLPAPTTEDANVVRTYGGRLAIRIEPVENLTVRLNGWINVARQIGENGVRSRDVIALGEPLFQFRMFDSEIEESLRYANAVVQYRFPFADLVSTSSVMHKDWDAVYDATSLIQGLGLVNPALGQRGTIQYHYPEERFSQEIRLVSTGDGPLQWTIGGYYGQKKIDTVIEIHHFGPLQLPGQVGTAIQQSITHVQYPQKAIFGEASYTFPIGLTATLGLRLSDIKFIMNRGANGIAGFSSPFGDFFAHSKPTTVKAELSYRVKDAGFLQEGLFYGNYRNAFRSGFGVNPLPAICDDELAALGLTNSSQVAPDTVDTYEGGAKLTLRHGMVANIAAYRTYWDGIQSSFGIGGNCPASLSANLGKARIDGVEAEIAGPLFLEGLDGSLNVAWTDARYTQKAPGISPTTDKLTLTPDWAVNVAVRYAIPSLREYSAYVSGDYQYQSAKRGINVGTIAVLDPYSNLNLRAGATVKGVGLQVWVRNVTDAYHIVGTPIGTEGRVAPNIPRTIGVTASYAFR